jgi:hypothetical protein
MTHGIVASSATFTCVIITPVLTYFTVKARIDAFDAEMEASDWLELSDARAWRTWQQLNG